MIHKEGKHKEVKKGQDGIHRLEVASYHKESKPKSIIFYKNGIHLEGFPFFYYGSHDAVSLLADLLDGYFPRQLEKSYPDGVLLKIVDLIDQINDEKAKQQKINSLSDPVNDMKPMSKDEFLQKIPEKIISADGKIIEVRKNVAARFDGKDNSDNKKTKLKNVEKNEAGDWVVKNEHSESENQEISILKVRLDFLDDYLIIQMPMESRIAELYRELMKCVPDPSKRYKLVNGFPRTDLDLSSTQSLEELGLYPKAAIYLVEINDSN